MEIERIKATIKALESLKGLEAIDFCDIKSNYGELWASVFDDLRLRGVVSEPLNDGRVLINQNYLAPSISHYNGLLRDAKRIQWGYIRSWIAIVIAILSLIISLLSLLSKTLPR